MDPITHAVVGLAIGSFSGGEVISNPLALGSLVGSVIPDSDIIYQYWGDYVYFKHHRGTSHSFLGLIVASFIIAGVLAFIFPSFSYWRIFLWTLMGCLSHVGLDMFNSYGAKVLWPFSGQRYGSGLLMIFDPFLFAAAIGVYVGNLTCPWIVGVVIALFILYLGFRYVTREYIRWGLMCRFFSPDIERVVVFPSLMRFLHWDFIVYKSHEIITGRADILGKKTSIRDRLENSAAWLEDILMGTALGKFFNEFSQYYHIRLTKHGENYQVVLTDLRYYMKDGYLHHATALFDDDMEPIHCVFHPYSPKRNIEIPV